MHSSYLRFPADVPSGGRRVALCLRVRRFLCPVISCGQLTFAGQLSGLTRRYGRRTERLPSTLAAVGLALAGQAGAQLDRVFGVPVSRSTVLRLVEALPDQQVPALYWSMSKAGGRWTCCPTGRHPAWPPGSRNGQGLRWAAAIAHRPSPKAPPSGHTRRCRWRDRWHL
ncbi:hypothetical protein [Streptomyces albidochromogenes]|nr:hypothetical protein [Streptomyces albidochromogenes]